MAATLARPLTRATALVLLLAAFGPTQANAQDHPCQSGSAVIGRVTGTADRFQITGRPQSYRLANIATDSPLPLPSKQTLHLYPVSDTPDRYGRIAVHAFAGERWLQGDALARGDAMADPAGQSQACQQALLAIEAFDTVVEADNLAAVAARAGLFTVIRGRILSLGDRKRRLYLNFGQKWDEDVTAVVAKTGRNRYRGDVDHLKTLEGRRVEIRGTVERNRGPVIRLKDAAQIRVLATR